MWWSWQHLQLEELGGLIQSTVVAGEGQGKVQLLVQVVGRSQLNAVVAAQAKCFCIHTGFFDQRLGDISNHKVSPSLLKHKSSLG